MKYWLPGTRGSGQIGPAYVLHLLRSGGQPAPDVCDPTQVSIGLSRNSLSLGASRNSLTLGNSKTSVLIGASITSATIGPSRTSARYDC